MYVVTGSDLFGQWFTKDSLIKEFQTVTINKESFGSNKAELIQINWCYNIFQIKNSFYISGAWCGKENQFIQVYLPEKCKNLADEKSDFILVGNDYELLFVDLKRHNMWVMDVEEKKEIKELSFLETGLNGKGYLTEEVKKKDNILKVVLTNHSCLYLTSEGTVYSGVLPSHVDTNHCVGKVCDVQCGHEHYMLLTDAGRVYTWGNGRRLQLGHGDLSNMDSPTEVEALAGVKIIKIKAGGWHSLALSEFGDLYVWGWNDTGQLGIKESERKKSQEVFDNEGSKSYSLPTLVDIFDESGKQIDLNIQDIACGSRHTAILLEDYTVWTTGYNKYGQLGFLPETHPVVNYFKKSFQAKDDSELMCGPWCTVLVYK